MKTKRLSGDDAIEKAQWIWENGFIQRTGHFEVELKNAGATMMFVEAVILGECKVKRTEWNQAYCQWRYAILGYDSEDCELHIVVSINSNKSMLILITAF